MTTDHIPDDAIETAIQKHNTPGTEDALSVDDARKLLDAIQASLIKHWNRHLDAIDDGHLEVVHEDQAVIVLADHTGHGLGEELDAAGVTDDVARLIIRRVYHEVANDRTDYSWSASSPLVVGKPPEWQTAEQHVRRSIARLARESGDAEQGRSSIARGADRWATERQGLTLKEWGDEEVGTDRPHQSIGKNARRGREQAAERQN